MNKTTRLSCIALLAGLGISLAQAAPILGQGQGAPGHANAPDFEFGYCSPDSEKITGFARCDQRNARGPQNGGGPALGLPDGTWQNWPPTASFPPALHGGLKVDVPEPTTLGLLGLGLLGLLGLRGVRGLRVLVGPK